MLTRRLSLTLIVATSLAFIPHHSSRATTQGDTSIEALTRASEVIVRGMVIDVIVHPSGPGGRAGIHTEVRIAAHEFLAGPPVSVVTLWVQGGRVGRQARVVPGQARFRLGEDVLVFLFDAGGGALFPTGMSHGKWESGGGNSVSSAGGRTMPLADLRAAVRQAVRR